jgi:hypothetical protein
VEIKYGYRTGLPGQTGSNVKSEPGVDPEIIEEIESYYEQKKLRDLSRNLSGNLLYRGLPERLRPSERSRAPMPESGNEQGK